MGHTVRAKFRVLSTKQVTSGERLLHQVEMSPVYSNVEGSENKTFWDATPTGSFVMRSIITDFFEVGAEYYLDISKAE